MNKLVDTTGSEARRLPAEWQSGIAMARKYATSGPRYTSYPTAPQFSDDFDVQRYLNWQVFKERHADPLSIYVHLPFCHDICYYCACNKVVTRVKAWPDAIWITSVANWPCKASSWAPSVR
jgi:oxygen-independent coproporphyrinogen-3 oxidase